MGAVLPSNILPYFTKSDSSVDLFEFSEREFGEVETYISEEISVLDRVLVVPAGWSEAQISHYFKDGNVGDSRVLIADICAELALAGVGRGYVLEGVSADNFVEELSYLLFSGKFYFLETDGENAAAELYIENLPEDLGNDEWRGLLSRIDSGEDVRIVFDEKARGDYAAPRGVLDLLAFIDDDGFDFEGFAAASKIACLALNCKMEGAARDIALGFANLAAVIMGEALAYESCEAREFAALIASVMQKEVGAMAADIGGYSGVVLDMDGVEAGLFVAPTIAPLEGVVISEDLPMGGRVKRILPTALAALAKMGYTHRQIERMMTYVLGRGSLEDSPSICHAHLWELGFTPKEITAVELALDGAEEIGSSFNQWVLGEGFCRDVLGFDKTELDDFGFDMLAALGFEKEEIAAASLWHCGAGGFYDAPSLKRKDYRVFDCSGKKAFEAEILMRKVLSPYISGGIFDRLLVPYSYDLEDLHGLYNRAKSEGLRVLSVYKEGLAMDIEEKGVEYSSEIADIEILEDGKGRILKIIIEAKNGEGLDKKDALKSLAAALDRV